MAVARRLSYPASTHYDMQEGTVSHHRNPIRNRPLQARSAGTCRGRSAWHARNASTGTWEALPTPDAPNAGTRRVGEFNDKKNAPTEGRETDRFVVARGKVTAPTLAKGPT